MFYLNLNNNENSKNNENSENNGKSIIRSSFKK